MPDVALYPFSETWWLYGVFLILVLGMLALDLGVFHRKEHAVGMREAAAWSVAWVLLSLAFNWAFYQTSLWWLARDERLMAIPGFDPVAASRNAALEFLAGYLVEKALSVDNIFVMVVLFSYFGIPAKHQHRVLYYGILGAIVFRGIFIGAGAVLLRFEWVMWAFGAFLIFTGVKMCFVDAEPKDPSHNPVLKLLARVLPITSRIEGRSFFTRVDGRLAATPLLVALVAVETTDVVFAFDSVPAIFALTREPLIVFTSNIFAILGLRALYFLLQGAVDRFHLLKYGLGAVLVFVGLKMVWLNEHFGGKFPIVVSLAIIGGTLAASILLSLLFPKREADVS